MDMKRQQRAPIYEALEVFKKRESFHLMYPDTKEAGAIRNSFNCWVKNA